MRHTIGAGTYFGIPVRIHFTFPLILLVFGVEAWIRGGWQDALHAIVLTLAVFLCVVLHEFGHSLQVRRYGIAVRDIVLLPIGGMARMERIPENPWKEIVVAISGPLVNFVLAGLILLALLVTRTDPLDMSNFGVQILAINLVLGAFNLIPAFPMDGGRILRGLLAMRLPYLRATGVARAVGQVIAILFVIVGFYNSSFLMLPVIAVFIFVGAMNEERAIRVRHLLSGRALGDLVDRDQPILDGRESIASAGAISSGGPLIALTDGARLATAAVRVADVRRAIRDGRGDEAVGTLAVSDFPVLRAEMPATQAYYFLKAEHARYAGVVDADGYIGIIDSTGFLRVPR